MANAEIRLGDPPDSLDLRLLEYGTVAGRSEGELRIGVSVSFDEFAGTYDQIWIGKANWASFISSLGRLERERTGKASLFAMSPDEFELHLEVVDASGHLDAHGFLSRYHFPRRSNALRSRIEFRFGVDPSLLRELVRSFAAFARAT